MTLHRRGGIYIVVLATACIVTIIGLASMATWRLQAAAANATADAAEARLNANSAVEAAAYYLNSDPNWRTSRSQGTWWSGVSLGRGSYTIAGTDPSDGDFTNRPYDNLLLTCTGRAGTATHVLTVTLKPQGTPIAALAMAIHTPGQFRINGGTLTASGAPISTNGNLRLDGTLAGSAECLTRSGSGTASGTVTILAGSKPMPPAGVIPMYQSLGTPISTGSTTLQKFVLSPASNPFGSSLNADGLYVLSTSSDITISNARICGTLVVIAPGRTVTISGSVLMQPARSDYPALIVNGMLVLQADGTTPLSEATNATNFNPAGTPYQGAADSDVADTYPSEIDGLVHCTDKLSLLGNQRVRGAIICESTDGTQAVYTDNTPGITYDPNLYSNPPMGYTTSVTLKILAGSWQQSVLP